MHGDILGWGSYLGSKLYLTREKCAEECDRFVDCLSFEHSNTAFLCNLNTIEEPSKGPFKDYVFCSKISKWSKRINLLVFDTRTIIADK